MYEYKICTLLMFAQIMETRVFSPSAYTFGEQWPRPNEAAKGKKRKSEGIAKTGNASEKTGKNKDGSKSANGSGLILQPPPEQKKRNKRTSSHKTFNYDM